MPGPADDVLDREPLFRQRENLGVGFLSNRPLVSAYYRHGIAGGGGAVGDNAEQSVIANRKLQTPCERRRPTTAESYFKLADKVFQPRSPPRLARMSSPNRSAKILAAQSRASQKKRRTKTRSRTYFPEHGKSCACRI